MRQQYGEFERFMLEVPLIAEAATALMLSARQMQASPQSHSIQVAKAVNIGGAGLHFAG